MQRIVGEIFTLEKTKGDVVTMSDKDINAKYKKGGHGSKPGLFALQMESTANLRKQRICAYLLD
ncbi:MAG: hypothetical protein GWP17_01725 [Aquificales bacterium]|nr:hypothetical protein [Aquificales bacterium]